MNIEYSIDIEVDVEFDDYVPATHDCPAHGGGYEIRSAKLVLGDKRFDLPADVVEALYRDEGFHEHVTQERFKLEEWQEEQRAIAKASRGKTDAEMEML